MPIECTLLKYRPEPLQTCPRCGAAPFKSFMRGSVQRTAWSAPFAWLWWFLGPPTYRQGSFMPEPFRYCAVICSECKEIVEHEAPLRWP